MLWMSSLWQIMARYPYRVSLFPARLDNGLPNNWPNRWLNGCKLEDADAVWEGTEEEMLGKRRDWKREDTTPDLKGAAGTRKVPWDLWQAITRHEAQDMRHGRNRFQAPTPEIWSRGRPEGKRWGGAGRECRWLGLEQISRSQRICQSASRRESFGNRGSMRGSGGKTSASASDLPRPIGLHQPPSWGFMQPYRGRQWLKIIRYCSILMA